MPDVPPPIPQQPPMPPPMSPPQTEAILIRKKAKDNTGCGVVAVIFAVLVGLLAFIGAMVAILIPAFNQGWESASRASCQNNLKQIGLICKMYANESKDGYYPAHASSPGVFVMTPTIYPDYLSDTQVFVCPSDSYMWEGEYEGEGENEGETEGESVYLGYSYTYIAHGITNEEEGLAYLEALTRAIEADQPLNTDLTSPDGQIFKHNSESSLNDVHLATETVICFDDASFNDGEEYFSHIPGGGNVLYADGHVAFVHMGEFPYVEDFLNTIDEVSSFSQDTYGEDNEGDTDREEILKRFLERGSEIREEEQAESQ